VNQNPWTDTEFQRMRDLHLPYELLMLQRTAEALSEPRPSEADLEANVRRWMAIECFYIHLRNLDAFFHGSRTRKRKKDAVATDFFEDPALWRSSRPGRTRAMREAVELAGTMVVHLSYDRQRRIEAGAGLNWLGLAREMDAVYQAFQRAVSMSAVKQVPLRDAFRIAPIVSVRAIEYGPETTVSTMTASTPSALEPYLRQLGRHDRDDGQ
jgi:hypothetical protein